MVFKIPYDMRLKENNKNMNDIGQYTVKDDTIYIKCAKGVISAKSLQFEGKRIISIRDFRNMNSINNNLFE